MSTLIRKVEKFVKVFNGNMVAAHEILTETVAHARETRDTRPLAVLVLNVKRASSDAMQAWLYRHYTFKNAEGKTSLIFQVDRQENAVQICKQDVHDVFAWDAAKAAGDKEPFYDLTARVQAKTLFEVEQLVDYLERHAKMATDKASQRSIDAAKIALGALQKEGFYTPKAA